MQVLRKFNKLITIAFVFAAQTGLAQSSPELDITLQVLRDSQSPQGTVNQLELPPPEFFTPNTVISDSQENLIIEETIDQNGDAADDAEILATDNEPDTDVAQSVTRDDSPGDGDSATAVVNSSVEDVVSLPEPRQTNLQETLDSVTSDTIPAVNNNALDSTTDTVTGIVDNLGSLPTDSVGDVTDSVNDVLDTTTDAVSGISGTADAVLDNTSNAVEDSAGNLDNLTDTLTDSTTGIVEDSDIVDGLGDQLAPTEELLDNALDEELLQETIDTTQENIAPEDVLNDTVNDLTDSLPGI